MTVATLALAVALAMAPAEPARTGVSDPVPGDAAAAQAPAPTASPPIPMAPSTPAEGQPEAPLSPAAPAAAPAAPPPPVPSPAAAEQKPAGDDIVVTAREDTPGDPLANLNAKSYEAIQAVDQAVVGPVSMGYKHGMPKPLRLGLRNFLRNLEEPVIAFNYLLQLKPGRMVKSVGRFALNSTIGIGGLVDMAKRKPFNLPYTPNGFANTFACYGIGPGPYFFLPLIGPTTLRDIIGVGMDRAALPAVVGAPLDQPYYAIPANVIDSLNDRIDIDEQLKEIRGNSGDPYAATRDLYLRQRKAEIAAICPKKGEVVDPALPPRAGKGRD